jgi:WD40 repeat protein
VADVFISYSRRDSVFVERLRAELEDRGKDVWLDVDGIRDAEVFPAALRRAIERSDAFVFVISPDSVRSPFCEQEVGHAIELNKRLVPVALREVADQEIPTAIRVRNWIPFDDFPAGVDRLAAAIEADLDWEHQHTRLTVKALEWQQADGDRSFLLRGSELAAAEQWLAAGAGKSPGPSAIEQAYLLASRSAASRRQRRLVALSVAVAAVSVGLLVFALISRGEAVSARGQALREALTAKARALAAESETQLSVDPERSILLAVDAVRASAIPASLFALREALDASAIRYRLPNAGLQNCDMNLVDTAPGVAFSPDGRRLAEGRCDGTIVIADAQDGRVIRRIHVGSPAGPVAYTRDGSLLAADAGGRVVLLDPATASIRATGPSVAPGRLAFSPRGNVLAVETQEGGLELWNFATGRTRRLIRGSQSAVPINALAFSPDGGQLAVALGTDLPGRPGLELLDADDGRVLASRQVPADDAAFSPDGSALAVAETPLNGTSGGRIVLLSSHTLALRRTLVTLPAVEAAAVAFSPDGSRIAYGGYDGTAGLISAQTGQTIGSYLGQTARITQIAFSPSGQLVATASADGTLRAWRATGLQLGSVDVGGTIDDLQPIEHGFVALGQLGGRSGIVVQRWNDVHGGQADPPVKISPTASVDADFISANGRLAGLIPIASSPFVPIRIWSVAKRRVIATVPRLRAPFGGEPVFSPDGTSIALNALPTAFRTPAAATLSLLDVRTGGLRSLATTSCSIGWRSFPFSDNGKLIAGGTFCGQVDVFDVETGRRTRAQFDIGGELAGIAFSPDGRRIAVASWDSTVTVADVTTNHRFPQLTEHTKGVTAVAYSPNGRYLASASLDDTVEIWDAHTLTLLRVIHQPDPTYGVAFTPDSRDILTYDQRGVVREWDACTACENPRALLTLARTRVTRRLTPQERQTFATG